MCRKGLGEIELHFHHNRVEPFPDTEATFRVKISNALRSFSRFGIFPVQDGKARFSFIHGDWALDNSRGDKFCGINNELEVLSSLGCYADFTFPALYESQPAMINKIFYANEDPLRPKSYNIGQEVSVGSRQGERIMIIQGPLGIRARGISSRFLPAIEWADIANSNPPTCRRVDFWINTAIAVKGREDFVFVKLHTHGAWEGCSQAMFAGPMDDMLNYLETRYNDRSRYFLHYVTAREMYNCIKALEAGKSEYSYSFRDFAISAPEYRIA
jgi:hypothetical protein